MKTPPLPKKLLMTLLSLTSLSAQAGEVWIKVGGRLLKADVRAGDEELAKLSPGEILDQLRDAEVHEVPLNAPSGGGGPGKWPTWTEGSRCPPPDRAPVDGVAPSARPAPWTEIRAPRATWTESSHRVAGPWTEKRGE